MCPEHKVRVSRRFLEVFVRPAPEPSRGAGVRCGAGAVPQGPYFCAAVPEIEGARPCPAPILEASPPGGFLAAKEGLPSSPCFLTRLPQAPLRGCRLGRKTHAAKAFLASGPMSVLSTPAP